MLYKMRLLLCLLIFVLWPSVYQSGLSEETEPETNRAPVWAALCRHLDKEAHFRELANVIVVAGEVEICRAG